MTAATVAAPADPEDDGILDRCRCACGRVAAIVFEMDDEGPWCAIRCECGAFAPAAAESGSR